MKGRLSESPHIRYFSAYPNCSGCGKTAQGVLYGTSNESYGAHCRKCADKRIRASADVRALLASTPADRIEK